MKKVKRIIAMIGVIALLALYVSTIVLAIIGSEQALNLLKAAIYSTVVLPVLLWTYSFVYKLLKDHFSVENEEKRKNAPTDEIGEENKKRNV